MGADRRICPKGKQEDSTPHKKKWTPQPRFFLDPKKGKNFFTKKSFLSISVRFGISSPIRIGRETQCLPYAGFLSFNSVFYRFINLSSIPQVVYH